MKSKVLWFAVLILAVIAVAVINGCVQQTVPQSFSNADFTKCLTDNGVKVYGAYWCEHCVTQKELFGDAWGRINYIDCSVQGSEELNKLCIDAGITGLPTWEFKDGARILGRQTLITLSQASGCPVPGGPIEETENAILFVGPQQALQATVNSGFSYSFCKPDVKGSGATCGGLEGTASDPIGGVPPYSFIVSPSGLLPPGLRLNLNGLLEGTPALPGSYGFDVCAKDLSGNEECRYVDVLVGEEGETTVAPETPKDTTESITYQIDVDATLTYVGTPEYAMGHSGYTEHTVFSTQKTVTRKGPGYKFESQYGEQTPVKVSIEGYADATCMKGGELHTVRGTYSGSYDGVFEIDMAYYDEKSGYDASSLGVWVWFSQIEGLPTLPETPLVCIPSESDVGNAALEGKVRGLIDATTSVDTRMTYVATNGAGGPLFRNVEGGTIALTGPHIYSGQEALRGYTWSGSVAVKKIS